MTDVNNYLPLQIIYNNKHKIYYKYNEILTSDFILFHLLNVLVLYYNLILKLFIFK